MTHESGRTFEVFLCRPTDDGAMEWCTKVYLDIPELYDPVRTWPPEGLDTVFDVSGDDPRPVPWVSDLGRIMRAYGCVRELSDRGLAERLSAELRRMGEELVREHAPSASLHVVG